MHRASPCMAQTECSTFSLDLGLLHLEEVADPSFSETYILAHLHNLTCHTIDVSQGSLRFYPKDSDAVLTGNVTALCQTDFDLGNYHGHLHIGIVVLPSRVRVVSETEAERHTADGSVCSAAVSLVEQCGVDVHLTHLALNPPQKALDWILASLRERVESDAEKYVCQVAAPRYVELLLNKTLVAPTVPPAREDGALPLERWPLVRAITQVATCSYRLWNPLSLDVFVGPSESGWDDSSSTVRFYIITLWNPKTIYYSVNVNTNEQDNASRQDSSTGDGAPSHDLSSFVDLLSSLVLSDTTEIVVPALTSSEFPGLLWNLSGHVHLQPGTVFSFDVSLPSLRCDDAARLSRCHVPRKGGVQLSNLQLTKSGSAEYQTNSDMTQVFTNGVAPNALPMLESLIDVVTSRWETVETVPCENTNNCTDRVYIPMVETEVWHSTPPLWGILAFLTTALALFFALLRLSAARHAKNPVCWRRKAGDAGGAANVGEPEPDPAHGATQRPAEVAGDGRSFAVPGHGADGWEPVSKRRVMCEDAVLLLGVVVCTGCFIWSNCTTAANVVVGGEIELYAFSLMKTSRDLWGSGLHFLAVAVFVFSCVYPYFKLASILVFTIVLHRPEATALRVIDYIGKFSFLDTFVLLIMVTGLSDGSVVTVRIHASFFVFLVATVGSLAIGNYATTVWRRGTTLRSGSPAELALGDDEESRGVREALLSPPTAAAGTAEETELSVGDSARHGLRQWLDTLRRFLGSIQWVVSVPSFLLVLLCTRPAWNKPCLRYKLGGLAPLVMKDRKEVSLTHLQYVDRLCGLLLSVTLFYAPCAYTLVYPRFQFLSTWCAAEVFLLACVAGLLQLNQFVQFVIGEQLHGIYTAHAVLLGPLFPLLVASLIQWFLTAAFLRNVNLQDKVLSWVTSPFRSRSTTSQPDGGQAASPLTTEAVPSTNANPTDPPPGATTT